eukprot:TRINITY_DN20606_c0_g1_i1.p1 TRINITY_DN20606_c0_g1~~TRINITY_DN20606_c0_g1_i1.p1  ORF type:complete len:135 (-),score=18.70 TRINITY_DN20606_c0_g1_i1:75-479(-)
MAARKTFLTTKHPLVFKKNPYDWLFQVEHSKAKHIIFPAIALFTYIGVHFIAPIAWLPRQRNKRARAADSERQQQRMDMVPFLQAEDDIRYYQKEQFWSYILRNNKDYNINYYKTGFLRYRNVNTRIWWDNKIY